MNPRAPSQLGGKAVHVDRLALGLVPLGNLYRAISDEQAFATLQAWWDRGLRTFEVAPLYGFGVAERRLGAFLQDRPRDQFVVSTEVGRPVRLGEPPDPTYFMPDGSPQFHDTPEDVNPYHDFSRDGILWSLEQSLERLQLERMDYVHLHDPDEHLRQAIDEGFPTLSELRAQGVIGAIGADDNWSSVALAMLRGCALDCLLLAGRYSILDHEGLAELLPACAGRNVSVLVGGVLNSGFTADPRPGAMYQYKPCHDPALIERALGIKAVAARHGVSITAVAVQFPLGHPAVAAVVVGAGSPAHAREVDDAFEAPVPDALWAELLDAGQLPSGTPVPQSATPSPEASPAQ